MNARVKIAFRNVLSNWRPSAAAIISVAAGFLSLSIFQGYITNVDAVYHTGFRHRAMYGDLLVEDPKIYTAEGRADAERFYMTAEAQAKIEKYLLEHSDDLETRVRFLTATGTVTNGLSSFIFVAMGFDPEEGARVRAPEWTWEAMYGKPLLEAGDPQGALLGQALGSLLSCRPTPKRTDLYQNRGYAHEVRSFECARPSIQLSTMTLSGQVNAMELNVVGLIDGGYKDIDERWVKTSLANVQTLLNTDKIRFMSLLLKDESRWPAFRDGFNAFAEREGLGVRAQHWTDHPLGGLYRQTKNLLNVFQAFIVTVVLIIVCLSVFNTMMKNVKERTREIGTLRSIGFTGRQVASIFCWEAGFIAVAGSLLGFALSASAATALNAANIVYRAGLLSEPVLFRISYDVKAYLFCFVLLVLLSVLAAWVAVRGTVRNVVAGNLTHV